MKVKLNNDEKKQLKGFIIGVGIALILLLAVFLASLACKEPDIISPLGSGIPMAYAAKLDEEYKAKQQDPDPQQLIEDEIRRVFGDKADEAIMVARCESKLGLYKCNDGLNSNGSVDCGVFQINSIHGVSRKWLDNYKINIQIAKQLYDEHGNWSAWYSSRSCHGLQ